MVLLNTEICELIGAFIGDGYLSINNKNRSYIWGISGNQVLDEDYLKNHLSKIIRNNFPNVNVHLYYRRDENTLMLRVHSKELCFYFKEIGFEPGKKTRTVVIPKSVLENDEFIKAAIRGIFDTDGCLFFDKRKKYLRPYPRIVLQMASIPLIKQLAEILSKDFKLYVNTNNRDGKRNSLEIYGWKQLEKFLKEIGFSNKRHLSKLTPL